MTTQTMKITGLTCEACTKLTAKKLQKIDGVEEATVDLDTGKASLHTKRPISTQEANAALEGTHYHAEEYDEQNT